MYSAAHVERTLNRQHHATSKKPNWTAQYLYALADHCSTDIHDLCFLVLHLLVPPEDVLRIASRRRVLWFHSIARGKQKKLTATSLRFDANNRVQWVHRPYLVLFAPTPQMPPLNILNAGQQASQSTSQRSVCYGRGCGCEVRFVEVDRTEGTLPSLQCDA
jgi:hypothetical protein